MLVRDGQENHLQNWDEDWIIKYRAALSKVGPPQSRFASVRTALMNAYQVVAARLGKSLGHRTQAERRKPVAVPSLVSKQEPRTPQGSRLELRKPNRAHPINKSPSRKTSRSNHARSDWANPMELRPFHR